MKGNFEDYFEFEENESFTVIKGFKGFKGGFQSVPDFRGHEFITFSEDIFEIPPSKFLHGKLKSVYFPYSVGKIGDSAFKECRSLRIVQFDEGLSFIGNSAFFHTPISQAVLPDSLEKIGNSAFKDCNKLLSIAFGNGLLEIESFAFSATAISKISLPPSLCKIGVSAFEGCSRLSEITFENLSFEDDCKQILNILNNSNYQEQIYFSSLILNCCENYIPFILESIPFSVKCEAISEFNSLLNIISSDFAVNLDETEALIKKLDEKNFLISDDFNQLSKLACEYKKSNLNEFLFSMKNKLFPEKADISEMFKL